MPENEPEFVDGPLGRPGQRPERRELRRVLLAAWQAGNTLVQLEQQHRMAHRTVRQLLEEAGADLPPRRAMFNLRGSERAVFAASLLDKHEANPDISLHALAKQHQVSPQTAQKLLAEAQKAKAATESAARWTGEVGATASCGTSTSRLGYATHVGAPQLPSSLDGARPSHAAGQQLQDQPKDGNAGSAGDAEDQDQAKRQPGHHNDEQQRYPQRRRPAAEYSLSQASPAATHRAAVTATFGPLVS